ncbi:MAG: 50S ribosomal protein L11 methyltransferase [Firmicutes bacterium]|nr:50S ribosomal protein L11 methyltransferase [Bacillota bacterium]
MKYAFLSVITTTEFSDIVAQKLFEAGSAGVSIKDRRDLLDLIRTGKNWDYIDESAFADLRCEAGWRNSDVGRGLAPAEKQVEESTAGASPRPTVSRDAPVIVTGFFGEADDLYAILKDISALKNDPYFKTGSLEISTGIEDSEIWENVWKQYYQPIPFNRITIVPVWLKETCRGDGLIDKSFCEQKDSDTIYQLVDESVPPTSFIPVYLDPGLAFGTGMHETTAMCIELIEELTASGNFSGISVADVGCGSGILGICALKLGASTCSFLDIDSIAVCAAQENAAHNAITDAAEFVTGDFSAAKSLRPDLILANLTADLLMRFHKTASAMLSKNGTMVVSGILDEYAQSVINEYSKNFAIQKTKNRNGWQAMLLTKNE